MSAQFTNRLLIHNNRNRSRKSLSPLVLLQSDGPSWVHEDPVMHVAWEEDCDDDDNDNDNGDGSSNSGTKYHGRKTVGRRRRLGQGREKRKNGKFLGVHSLRYLAMRQTLGDQRNLRVELFGEGIVPFDLVREMWECLGWCGKQTLYMWKLLATAYPRQFRELCLCSTTVPIGSGNDTDTDTSTNMKESKHRRQRQRQLWKTTVRNPKMTLRDYLGLVRSDRMDWGTVLTVGTRFGKVPEFVEIGGIATNLVALEVYSSTSRSSLPSSTKSSLSPFLNQQWQDEAIIIPNDPTTMMTSLNDRIIRTWSELARTSNAFRHLHVLSLYNQPELSGIVLRYLRSLPSLRVVLVRECPGIGSVVQKGQGKNADLQGWEVGSFLRLMGHTTTPATADTTTDTNKWSNTRDENENYTEYSLYECYEASLDMVYDDAEEAAMSRDMSLPILDFQIGWADQEMDSNYNKKKKLPPEYQPIVLLRRKDTGCTKEGGTTTDTTPERKRAKLGSAEHANLRDNRSKRAVMKDRSTKDLGSVLSEFL